MESERLPLETVDDDYEPPPHVFAVIAQGAVPLFRRVAGPLKDAKPERTQWRKVWPTTFEAIAFAFFTTFLVPLLRLQYRFRADWRGPFWVNFRLTDAGRRNQEEFWSLATSYGAQIVLIGPLKEELLFRGLPILVARALEQRLDPRAGRIAVLTIAAVASLLFAWMHHPVLGAMPLPQLALGALAWSVAWRRGLRYSVLLHALYNFFIFAPYIVRIYERTR